MKLAQCVWRPSLLWLSVKQVRAVRDKIIGLYLAPGHYVFYGRIKVFGGAIPAFKKKVGAHIEVVHFKWTKEKKPQWDWRVDDGPIHTVEFNKILWAAKLVRDLHNNFPFKPTENWVHNIDSVGNVLERA